MLNLYVYDEIVDEQEEVTLEDIELLPGEYVVGYQNVFRKLFDVKSLTHYLGTDLKHFLNFYKGKPELLEDLVEVRLVIAEEEVMKHFSLTPYLTGLYLSYCLEEGNEKAIEIIDYMAVTDEDS